MSGSDDPTDYEDVKSREDVSCTQVSGAYAKCVS